MDPCPIQPSWWKKKRIGFLDNDNDDDDVVVVVDDDDDEKERTKLWYSSLNLEEEFVGMYVVFLCVCVCVCVCVSLFFWVQKPKEWFFFVNGLMSFG